MPWYNSGKSLFVAGFTCYWSSTTASFYATLVRASYIPSESHVYASAFSGSELSSTSFTAGYNGTQRISLTVRTVTINNVSNIVQLSCADLSWAGISAGTAGTLVIFAQSGSDALSPLIGFTCAGGLPVTTNGTNLTISFGSAGILSVTD